MYNISRDSAKNKRGPRTLLKERTRWDQIKHNVLSGNDKTLLKKKKSKNDFMSGNIFYKT